RDPPTVWTRQRGNRRHESTASGRRMPKRPNIRRSRASPSRLRQQRADLLANSWSLDPARPKHQSDGRRRSERGDRAAGYNARKNATTSRCAHRAPAQSQPTHLLDDDDVPRFKHEIAMVVVAGENLVVVEGDP